MKLGPRAKMLKTGIIGTQSPFTNPNQQVLRLRDRYNLVVDIGCGNGRHFIFTTTVGVDLDISILNKAKTRGMCIYADAHDLPIREDVFDLALLCYSLEYVKDPEKVKREAQTVSKDSFILTMPSSKYTWDKVAGRGGC
ncbi:hypothetical protein LCGC14_2055810 [marine sediment metagenome]|uniref:Methyltransferase type 11 domain-containing protein n=1 Tax=marine sediment metagenome TaxID=412755 RepID=A0A0F9H151_9ZZZZ